ncbi:hypothetical protein B0H99_102281 [Planomicrobium soli]|uniref:Uncharacterized protein n=1 Tax=Planomicrobium soli TaxID=1176648 RepID=A0A2P8H5U2_9BACL|nr:hypothetical protein [Planomicrobium soli]PSL41597.1 hypothetical protein B0H99_102281 [Planomicrobium soli]
MRKKLTLFGLAFFVGIHVGAVKVCVERLVRNERGVKVHEETAKLHDRMRTLHEANFGKRFAPPASDTLILVSMRIRIKEENLISKGKDKRRIDGFSPRRKATLWGLNFGLWLFA